MDVAAGDGRSAWALVLAGARVMPAALAIPALGGPSWPGPRHLALSLALGAALVPMTAAAADLPVSSTGAILALAEQVLLGVPVALVTAAPLWAGTQIGAFADQVRGELADDRSAEDPLGGTGFTRLTGLLVSAAWLSSGGVVRLLWLMNRPWDLRSDMRWALTSLLSAVSLGLRLAMLMVVPMLAFEVLVSAVGRLTAPLSPRPIARVARPLVAVWVFAASIEVAARELGGS